MRRMRRTSGQLKVFFVLFYLVKGSGVSSTSLQDFWKRESDCVQQGWTQLEYRVKDAATVHE